MNIVVALIALSILILVHELGHFAVAKWSGIKVLEFSIFMGPKLFSIKKGETTYSIRAIPMGGYVKMEGEEEESDDDRAYNKKPVGIRAAVIAAGPIMNIIIAIIIITVISTLNGFYTKRIESFSSDSPAFEAGLQENDIILEINNKKVFHPDDLFIFMYVNEGEPINIKYKRDGIGVQNIQIIPKEQPRKYRIGFSGTPLPDGTVTTVIRSLTKGYPLYEAGAKVGDKIIKINDKEVMDITQVSSYLYKNKNEPLTVTIDRDGEIKQYKVTPKLVDEKVMFDLGVEFKHENGNVIKAFENSFNYSVTIMRSVFVSIGWIATNKVPVTEMSGPVGIVTTIGDVVDYGQTFYQKLILFLSISSVLSLNLGVFNLIPIPALDGSKLVLLLVEKIRRKALPVEKEAIITMVGFVFLIALLIFTVFNDIIKLVAK